MGINGHLMNRGIQLLQCRTTPIQLSLSLLKDKGSIIELVLEAKNENSQFYMCFTVL